MRKSLVLICGNSIWTSPEGCARSEQLPNVQFQFADVFALPFADASFDVVWTKYLLQWLKEPERALNELKRVTRPGGIIVSCDFASFAIEHFQLIPISTERFGV